jgi:hypothetical protein
MKDFCDVQFFHNLLRKEISFYAEEVADGNCKDFAAYKELCGVIRGLTLAERTLLDLAKESEDEDEYDD